jgi:hypothetical protein
MDDTHSSDILGTSSQKVDLSDFETPNELQKEPEESIHKETEAELKALYITLSKLLDEFMIRLNLKDMEESERIRKVNDIIERIQRPK